MRRRTAPRKYPKALIFRNFRGSARFEQRLKNVLKVRDGQNTDESLPVDEKGRR
jgi:hypothetical protein